MGKIIAFSGSNSEQSINQKLMHAIAELIEIHQVEVLNLRDYPAPIYGIDLEKESGIPTSMITLKEKMKQADGFIVATPEHNGSMTALLKNTFDWLSRVEQKIFDDKPTVFMTAAPGARGGISALDHLVAIMPYRGAKIVGQYSLGNFGEHYSDGKLDEATKMNIKEVLTILTTSI